MIYSNEMSKGGSKGRRVSSVFRVNKSHKRRGGGGGRGGCLKKSHESGGRTRARKTVSRGVQEQPKGSQSYSQEAPGELPREAKECRRAPRVAWESQRMLRARYESPRTAPKSAGREATKRRRAPRVAWESDRKLLARYESPKKNTKIGWLRGVQGFQAAPGERPR